MSKPVNIDEIEWLERGNGGRIAARGKRIGMAAGAKEVGLSLYQLAPGKRSFPAHSHYAIEEGVLLLRGSADMRYGEQLIPLREGDYFALPAGTGIAHQVQNNGLAPCEYLCISNVVDPDVISYPDSNKTGVMAGFKTGEGAPLAEFYRRDPVAYFDGEE